MLQGRLWPPLGCRLQATTQKQNPPLLSAISLGRRSSLGRALMGLNWLGSRLWGVWEKTLSMCELTVGPQLVLVLPLVRPSPLIFILFAQAASSRSYWLGDHRLEKKQDSGKILQCFRSQWWRRFPVKPAETFLPSTYLLTALCNAKARLITVPMKVKGQLDRCVIRRISNLLYGRNVLGHQILCMNQQILKRLTMTIDQEGWQGGAGVTGNVGVGDDYEWLTSTIVCCLTFDSFLFVPPPSFSLRLATELFFSFLAALGKTSESGSGSRWWWESMIPNKRLSLEMREDLSLKDLPEHSALPQNCSLALVPL